MYLCGSVGYVCVWICMYLFESVWICLYLCGSVWISLSLPLFMKRENNNRVCESVCVCVCVCERECVCVCVCV